MKEEWASPGMRPKYFYQYIGRFLFHRETRDDPRLRLHRFLREAAILYPHRKQRAGVESSDPEDEAETK